MTKEEWAALKPGTIVISDTSSTYLILGIPTEKWLRAMHGDHQVHKTAYTQRLVNMSQVLGNEITLEYIQKELTKNSTVCDWNFAIYSVSKVINLFLPIIEIRSRFANIE